MSNTSVDVHVTEQEAVIRARGRMTFVEAHPLRKFCMRMMKQGVSRYILNAEACTSMDSTFIGVLAMVSLKGTGRGARVEICGADEQVRGQIFGLGLKRIFLFHERCNRPTESGTVLEGRGERSELRETIQEAHETLAKADAENEDRFKDVLTYLREAS